MAELIPGVNLSGIIQAWIIDPLFWVLIIVMFLVFTAGFLYIRKKRKLVYPAAEIVDLGRGKTSLNFLGKGGAGWFGKETFLFGLWDYGEEVLRTNKGELISDFSEEDFQEINGRRGVVFYRDPVKRLLFPINRLAVLNKELALEIAPADYTDAAISIIRKAEKETSDWKEKALQFIAWAMIVLFSFIAIIMIINMIKNSQMEASKLVLEAGKTCLESAKSVCSQFAMPSNAP